MRRFLVNAGMCNPKSVSRIITVAVVVAGGTGLLYSDSERTTSMSRFGPWRDSSMLQSTALEEPSVLAFPHDKFHPYLPRMGSVPSISPNEDSSRKAAGDSKSTADAAADVFPALVVITVSSKKHGKGVFPRSGSGTIIDPNGTILTCAHLVSNHRGMEVTSKGMGNSGGPLVNLDGELIGVNILGRAGAIGIYFAVPIDVVLKIMEHLKRNGTVVRLWLGMKMLDLDETLISQLKYRDPRFPSVTKGVLVVMVIPGSPADVAGIRPGDVLIKFQDKSIGSISEIVTLMGDEVGRPLKVVVKRARETLNFTVVAEATNPEI